MTIATLIDKQDSSELVRTQIATILAAETVAQQSLATAASEDPRLWALRVFEERDNPWTEFLEAAQSGAEQIDVAPIVSVRLDSWSLDPRASNQINLQTQDVRYFIDCFGYGVAEDSAGGHEPADYRAALEAQRAAKLARNILIAGEYTYLGLRGTVGRRRVVSGQSMTIDQEGSLSVSVVRLTLEARVTNTTPQISPFTIGGIDIDVTSLTTGEILAQIST